MACLLDEFQISKRPCLKMTRWAVPGNDHWGCLPATIHRCTCTWMFTCTQKREKKAIIKIRDWSQACFSKWCLLCCFKIPSSKHWVLLILCCIFIYCCRFSLLFLVSMQIMDFSLIFKFWQHWTLYGNQAPCHWAPWPQPLDSIIIFNYWIVLAS